MKGGANTEGGGRAEHGLNQKQLGGTLASNARWVLQNSSKTLFRFSCITDLYLIRAKRIETLPLQRKLTFNFEPIR